ncbi:MAG: fumarylacetoacetase, partial [Planctomycetota bacterium]
MSANVTNDPARRSFIEVDADSGFPIQNLPYGVFRPKSGGPARCGSIIGDQVIDLAELERLGLLPSVADQPIFSAGSLNGFASAGKKAWSTVRQALSDLLLDSNPRLRDDLESRGRVFQSSADVEMLLPMEVGDYTDFYSSKEHATNVGIMFRGVDNALQPNWLHLPVGYHGRASSLVVSGHPIRRPQGQTMPPDAEEPVFGPCR